MAIALEIDHVLMREIIRHRQPWRRRREAGIRRRVPLHRRAAAVPADADARNVLLKGIAHLIRGNRDLMHADLVAIIKRRRAAQGQQQHRRNASLRHSRPARHPRTVVIAEHPVRPRTRRQGAFVIGDDLFNRTRAPQRRQQGEIERHLRALEVVAVIGHQPLQRQIDFADQHPAIEFVDDAAHLGDHLVHLRLIGGVLRQNCFMRRPALAIMRIGRIVAELRILDQVPDHIDAEAVDPLAQPEAHGVVDRLAHLAVTPVQVRLLGEEGVIIILSGCLIERPGAAAEFRQPVVRRATVRLRIAPQIPVALRIVARASRLDEPGMLVGGVVGHEVEDQLETARMHGSRKRVEILHGAEQRIDPGVIRNVVTEIGHRRRKDRR